MKTTLLASSGSFITAQNLDPILPKKIVDCKIAYITTASKKVDDMSYVERQRERMNEMGLSYTEIDIEGSNEEELRKILAGYDVVIVEGGNTFYLLKAIRESGFESVIKDLIEEGVVYIGTSAGSYVACPSIIMATWSNRGFDRCGVLDYTAMNLVPFLVKAHYVSEDLKELEENTKDLQYQVRPITDDQAILVRDEEIEFLGEGEEVII